jgi:regulator of sigma E protease
MAIGSILLAIFGIGLLIFLHEGGHFLAARMAGVRVEVFSLGFGPRLGGFQWGGTDFRLSAVPFGGYVMVAGQDPSDRRYPASMSLWSKSVSQRGLFWSGGVLMNVLFALIVFPLVFNAGVKFQAPIVGEVAKGTAAWESGIEPGERIVEIAGKPIYSFQNQMIEVALQGNRPVEVVLEGPDKSRRVVTARPKYDVENGLFGLGLRPAFAADSAVLKSVASGGPAATAGLMAGDRIVSLNGKSPLEPDSIEGLQPIEVRVMRDGVERAFTVMPTPTSEDVPPMIGVVPLANIVEGIRPGSSLVDRLGLKHGDQILAVDDRPLLAGNLDRVASMVGSSRWLVWRDGEEVALAAEATPAERAKLVECVALGNQLTLQIMPTDDGAAKAAGIKPGDWIQTINGNPVSDWEDLRTTIRAAGTNPIAFGLLRPDQAAVADGLHQPSGEAVTLTATPQITPLPNPGWEMEISPEMVEIRAESFGEAVRLGTVCSIDLVKQMYVTLKRLITGEVGAKNLGGIIRISQVSYQAAQRGPSWFWYFLALLSVNLAFVNLLPIPVLDGGHLMFLLIEKVKGSPVSTKVFGYSQVVGLVFVLLLVLFVTYNDILRLL